MEVRGVVGGGRWRLDVGLRWPGGLVVRIGLGGPYDDSAVYAAGCGTLAR
jgi:hypothetical protein